MSVAFIHTFFSPQEEAHHAREQRRKDKLKQLWLSKNYHSGRVSLSDDEDGEAVPSETDGLSTIDNIIRVA